MAIDNKLGKSAISGLLWKFSERISAQLITFVVGIVLARLLSPSDYGAIALIMVFITLANLFVSSGFGNALVQKQDCTSEDFSSVFYFNLAFSWLVYGGIFAIAPFVAGFYHMPILCPTLRVLGLRIPLAGVNSVQQAFVSRNMLFRRFFWSTLIGTVTSAFVGIAMALSGFGVWALVAQYLTNSFMDTAVLWLTVRWRPTRQFSWSRLMDLLRFGWKILASQLLSELSTQLRTVIIGKTCSETDLAYYNRGVQFPNLIINNVSASVSAVLFPVLSRLQSDRQQLQEYLLQSIRMCTFLLAPLMLGMLVVAEDMVLLLLSEMWLDCVPFIRLACCYLVFYPLTTAQLQAINAIGRSDTYLRMEILKRILAVTLMVLAIPFGVMALAATDVVITLFAVGLNGNRLKSLLEISYARQCFAILPNLLRGAAMGGLVFLARQVALAWGMGLGLRLACCVAIGLVVYPVIALVTGCGELRSLLALVRQRIHPAAPENNVRRDSG